MQQSNLIRGKIYSRAARRQNGTPQDRLDRLVLVHQFAQASLREIVRERRDVRQAALDLIAEVDELTAMVTGGAK